MDRRQLVVQKARELFAERLEDALHVVRQDRQEMRGWQEPGPIRAVLRRTVTEGVSEETSYTAVTTVSELESGRAAGEPDRGQQREAVGQVLEAAISALEKMTRDDAPELSGCEVLGLECSLLLYARPSVLVSQGRLSSVPALWNLLEDQREDIEMAQRGVGRIEMLGHPEYDWAGTGFLVGDTTLMTTRRIAELFIENRGGQWSFRPGISAWMDYRSAYQQVSTAGFRVRGVLGVHENYDLALLEVEAPQLNGSAPRPLSIAAVEPPQLHGRPVYLLGYPARDGRRNEPEMVTRIFRDVYNVKRVMPGQMRGSLHFGEVQLIQHDCAPLGVTCGAPLIDLETQQVVGMQLSGRYLEPGTAIPLYALRDDPLLQRGGVNFTQATQQEREDVTHQLERLSRTRYWNEIRSMIGSMYQRAFGV